MPDFGGKKLPEDDETLKVEMQNEWGEAMCRALHGVMGSSNEAIFLDEQQVEYYHVSRLNVVEEEGFAIQDFGRGRTYAVTRRGDVIPSLQEDVGVYVGPPSQGEVASDIREIMSLTKKHLK